MPLYPVSASGKKWFLFLLITGVTGAPLFYHACRERLFLFDESYYYIAARELGEHGRFFIDFDPSSYLKNTKPYLFVFAQILSCKLFGWNEWALRLPTVLASIALIRTLVLFIIKRFDSLIWALMTGFIVLVAPFFISPHMAFTGDHDIPLTLFTTLFILHLYNYISLEEKAPHHLFLCCLYAALSVLTKGWMILFFLPASLVCLLNAKKFFPIFRNKGFLYGTGTALVLIGGWYLLREWIDPGYLKAVWEYEIGRYTNQTHAIHPEWTYYWKLIAFQQMEVWVIPVIMAVIFVLKTPPSKERSFLIFTGIHAACFLITLSFSSVKLDWYDAPALPLVILLAGFGLSYFIEVTIQLYIRQPLVPFIVLILLFGYPYSQLFNRTFHRFYRETYGPFMMQKQTAMPYTIVHSDYNPDLLFYIDRSLELFQTGHPVKIPPCSYTPGECLLVCEPVHLLHINRTYEYEKIDSLDKCVLLKIKKERR